MAMNKSKFQSLKQLPRVPPLPSHSQFAVEWLPLDQNCPTFSYSASRHMSQDFARFLKSDAGVKTWAQMSTIFKHYCQEEHDFILIEEFAQLMVHHFGKFSWLEVFGCHQNVVFANLREWVDYWYDPLGNIRVRLRQSRPTHQFEMLSSLPKLCKNSKNKMKYSFASTQDEDDGDLWGEDGELWIPEPRPIWFENVNPSRRDALVQKMVYYRKKLFRILLFHFPVEGITWVQRTAALLEFNITPDGDLSLENVRNYMHDIFTLVEKGPYFKLLRVRFDIPGLRISPRLLSELRLDAEYESGQSLLYVAKTYPPVHSTPMPISRRSGMRRIASNVMKRETATGAKDWSIDPNDEFYKELEMDLMSDAELLEAIPAMLQYLCRVLSARNRFSIPWNDLHKVDGFEEKSVRLELQKCLIGGKFKHVVEMTCEGDQCLVTLKKPHLFWFYCSIHLIYGWSNANVSLMMS